ncbi:protein TolR [Aestuariivirga sp.]|uniref:protein TolR n=1 Tax=Aestuariivirga sp. TaxID=2650926 RepID=UPI0039E5EC13
MGAAAGGAKGGYTGRNSRRRSGGRVMSDINVTPMVDVMLVLLIVFMVAAPLMTVGVPIELPKTQAKQLDSHDEPIAITVKADRTLFLQESPITLDALSPKLLAIAKQGYDEQILVRADTNVPYGAVMEVMGVLNSAGYHKIGLVTGNGQDKPKTTDGASGN